MSLEKQPVKSMGQDVRETSPKVSIGLPVYNGEKHLRESIESVLAQHFKDFELLISDNASTDSTWEICEGYARRDARIRLYRHETNQGAISNFRFVLERASAQYFMWHAHDDLMSESYIGECYSLIRVDPDCALVCGRHYLILPDGSVVPPQIDDFEFLDNSVLMRFHKGFTNCWRLALPFYGLIRRDLLSQLSFDRQVEGLDFVMTMELVLLGKFRQTKQATRYYRTKIVHVDLDSEPVSPLRQLSGGELSPHVPGVVLFKHVRMLSCLAKSFRTTNMTASEFAKIHLILWTRIGALAHWLYWDICHAVQVLTVSRPKVYKTLRFIRATVESGLLSRK